MTLGDQRIIMLERTWVQPLHFSNKEMGDQRAQWDYNHTYIMILTVLMGKGKSKEFNKDISSLHYIDGFPTDKKLDTNNYLF